MEGKLFNLQTVHMQVLNKSTGNIPKEKVNLVNRKTNLVGNLKDSCKINISRKLFANTIISRKSVADQNKTCNMLEDFLQELGGVFKKNARKNLAYC